MVQRIRARLAPATDTCLGTSCQGAQVETGMGGAWAKAQTRGTRTDQQHADGQSRDAHKSWRLGAEGGSMLIIVIAIVVCMVLIEIEQRRTQR